MTLLKRLRLAIPLTFLSLIPLEATIVGAVAFWDNWSGTRQAMTVFLGIMFAICVGLSVSIAFDRRIESIPWLRIATVIAFIALACGVSWVRDMV